MDKIEKPVLLIHEGEKAGQRWTLQSDLTVVGRGNECDLLLPERQISRQHIRIRRSGNQHIIEDLDSKNGTWVNGQPLKGEQLLQDGDEINLAMAVKVVYMETEATAPIARADNNAVSGVVTSGIRLDREARRVFVSNRELDPPLSLPQYRLLELLIDLKGSICTREQVITAVWPDVMSDGVSEQAIDALVRRLRDRVAEIDPQHQYIITVRGHGFRLDQGG
jgi:pSer/pThr/pTyr-binding forkhead associated (FHA) protein